MIRATPVIALLLLGGARAAAQEAPPVYQAQQRYSAELKLDGLARKEWTRDVFESSGQFKDESRWRLQLRPRIEFGVGKLLLGVGGDFNYSSDENDEPPPALIRDNYDSRDARLDLAFASLKAGWLTLEAGRFAMPVALTEMIWDRDLRPQGGAVTLAARDAGAFKSIGVTVLGARGSHVFDDGKANMLIVSGEVTFASETSSNLQVVGSFVRLTGVDELEPKIRRQNTRVAGELVNGYEVVDLIGRFRHDGKFSLQLVGDYCWNRAVDADNKGLWLAAIIGSTKTANARLEYTYAKVDKDATLAAYGTDDFFWVTGWEGHRVDFGLRSGEHSEIHAVGQLQRFKDSPRPEERDHDVKRLRVELRIFK